ncbi:hypothetical protein D3C85_1551660 [compost metagenome]
MPLTIIELSFKLSLAVCALPVRAKNGRTAKTIQNDFKVFIAFNFYTIKVSLIERCEPDATHFIK